MTCRIVMFCVVHEALLAMQRLPSRPSLYHLGLQNLRVPIDTGHQSSTDGSSNCLGHLPLVDRPQSGLAIVLDPSHLGDIFGHDAEILFTPVSPPDISLKA